MHGKLFLQTIMKYCLKQLSVTIRFIASGSHGIHCQGLSYKVVTSEREELSSQHATVSGQTCTADRDERISFSESVMVPWTLKSPSSNMSLSRSAALMCFALSHVSTTSCQYLR